MGYLLLQNWSFSPGNLKSKQYDDTAADKNNWRKMDFSIQPWKYLWLFHGFSTEKEVAIFQNFYTKCIKILYQFYFPSTTKIQQVFVINNIYLTIAPIFIPTHNKEARFSFKKMNLGCNLDNWKLKTEN